VFRVLDELVNKKDALTEQFNKMNQQHVAIKADMSQTNKKRKKTKEHLAEEKRKVQQILNSCGL
jgi:SMC interacting uncharacterized protein involved in chromosome segregation